MITPPFDSSVDWARGTNTPRATIPNAAAAQCRIVFMGTSTEVLLESFVAETRGITVNERSMLPLREIPLVTSHHGCHLRTATFCFAPRQASGAIRHRACCTANAY